MSYCVNCGVELASSEKVCPLCDTEVINPRSPWKEPIDRPYSKSLDVITRHIDRRYVAALMTTFLSIPVLVTVLCDILTVHRITWSMYVVGAGAVLFVCIIMPFYFRRYHMLTFIACNGLTVLGYLKLIELASGHDWFLALALPITAAATLITLVLGYMFRKNDGRKALIRASLILAAAGLFTLIIEIFTDLFALSLIDLSWSPYVIISCLILAIALLIIERRNNVKDEIRKRLFY